MEKQINIWDILNKYPQSDINHHNHKNNSGDTVMGMEEILEAMKDFSKQLLELAAENAELKFDDGGRIRVNKQSILNTINLINF